VNLSPIAAWLNLGTMTPQEISAAARRVEQLGFSELWYPNSPFQDGLLRASAMLSATQRLHVATGIACVYDYPARTMAAAQRVLYDQSDGRFLLGLGLSHPEGALVGGRPAYGSPVPTMRSYLEELDLHAATANAALSKSSSADRPSVRDAVQPRVIAALGPKMLGLARDMCAGAHPYLVPPEHTAAARRELGETPWLCVEQKVLFETDPMRARPAARRTLALYLKLSNYLNSWRRLGFDDDDFSDGGSDRLVDTLIAWGDESAIRQRLDDHLAAGATQVCVQPLATIDDDSNSIWWPGLVRISELYSLNSSA
jgi:probable F420-dependent oxidoreductase